MPLLVDVLDAALEVNEDFMVLNRCLCLFIDRCCMRSYRILLPMHSARCMLTFTAGDLIGGVNQALLDRYQK